MDIMKMHLLNNFMNYFEKEHELWKHLKAMGEITPCVITIV
jgi:hypothetical protein